MSAPVAAKVIRVLLVEDNAGDVRLTREALREADLEVELTAVADGEQALAFLRNEGEHAGAPRPDLILLDLNLPRKDGREVLKEIRQDEALRHIPVVILSTSQAEQDIVQSYRLGANAFVTKPAEIDQFFQVVQSLEQFWLAVAKLARP